MNLPEQESSCSSESRDAEDRATDSVEQRDGRRRSAVCLEITDAAIQVVPPAFRMMPAAGTAGNELGTSMVARSNL